MGGTARRGWWAWLPLAALLAGAGAVRSEPLDPTRVPEPLRPWVDWVLRGFETRRCPVPQGQETPVCAWPSRLSLELSQASGQFTQEWQIHEMSWVLLPGDGQRWPEGVSVDGRPAPVAERSGQPSLQLPRGRHALRGSFRWEALPEILQIPPATALLRVRVDGRELAFPRREADGKLWLREGAAPAAGESDSLELSVRRRLIDDLPTLLETQVELRVAGRAREAFLGRALPQGFAPVSLASPLPARLEPDGHLRVQLRPGTWNLSLSARAEAPAEHIGPPAPEGTWAEDEVWVFEARPELRQVTVEDGVQVDPSQTPLPAEWRALPAYLLQPGRSLHLVERQRGDADPAADALSLTRIFWLDFDGRGYTIADHIEGTVRRSDRLELREPALLGRAALAGQDQQITRRAGAAGLGVEVPGGPIELSADARLDGARAALPAVGWDQDFRSLSAQLNLPPGWRLIHAAGADRVETSWLVRWRLFDLFAVLVLALAAGRLFGPRAGALALVSMALIYTEPGAPRWLVALALAGEALRRVLPAGWALRAAGWLRGAALLALLLASLPFAVGQLRQAMYPALVGPPAWEQPLAERALAKQAPAAAAPEEATATLELDQTSSGERSARADRAYKSAPAISAPRKAAALRRHAADPNARLTTGPGLPSWQWTRVALGWSGPVPRDQELSLWLAPPWLNAVLGVLRVGLLAALLARLAGRRPWPPGALLSGAAAGLAPALLGAVLLPAAARAELPSQELLDELRQRLLEPPECRPQCAEIPLLRLELEARSLRLRLTLDAAAATAVALPGGSGSWLPAEVLLDGAPAPALEVDAGGLQVQVDAGRHELQAAGPLPDRDSIDLPLPLPPRRVEVQASGWSVGGVREDGRPAASLQLVRVRAAGESRAAEELAPGQLPPFVRVQRLLALGLDWRVGTQVEREGAPGATVVVAIPLLPGESVTSPEARVGGGRAIVNLTPEMGSLHFDSTLAVQDELRLSAPRGEPWYATWQLDASPIWHVESSGVPPIYSESTSRIWRLWPGEEVVLRISRPAGVEGPTLTLDRTALSVSPGRRASDATLSLTWRSSRGGEHPVLLPEGAELTSAHVDGQSLPLRQEGRRVVLPVTPGRHQAALAWREPRGISGGLRFRAPEVDVAQPGVNAEVAIAAPADRWLLFAGGPRLGPAVLFWPLLGVFVAAALALGRAPFSPLRGHQWLLLGLGLTQVPTPAAALVAAWLLALGWRRERGARLSPRSFDAVQLALVLVSLAALAALFFSVQRGLLGLPEMQVAGNGSSAAELRWYQDESSALLPQPWMISVPLWVYRALMLAWALWLAIALVGWLRFAATALAAGGFWQRLRRAR